MAYQMGQASGRGHFTDHSGKSPLTEISRFVARQGYLRAPHQSGAGKGTNRRSSTNWSDYSRRLQCRYEFSGDSLNPPRSALREGYVFCWFWIGPRDQYEQLINS
jgi:hypothetical protein